MKEKRNRYIYMFAFFSCKRNQKALQEIRVYLLGLLTDHAFFYCFHVYTPVLPEFQQVRN